MQKAPLVLGVLIVGAFVAGVAYFSRGSGVGAAAPTQSAAGDAGSRTLAATTPGAARSAAMTHDSAPVPALSSQPGNRASTPAPPPDPRLDALKVSPDNGLIEFVRVADGRVISEIDKSPGTPAFGRPLREYLYSGDKIVGLTAYRYLPGHVEVHRTVVSYRPDGSVDRFAESVQLQ